MHARVDLEYYKTGTARCKNWLVMKQGGLRRRPGTAFVKEVKDSTKFTRLIPFIFGTPSNGIPQAYVIELGNLYAQFITNGGTIVNAGVPVNLVTPWLEADLLSLDYAQSADVLTITHKSYAPTNINRLSDISWTQTPIVFQDGPYLDEPIKNTNGILPSATNAVTQKMTSNTTPSGVVSSSDGGATAWIAFDQEAATELFINGITATWVKYQLPSAAVCNSYIVI